MSLTTNIQQRRCFRATCRRRFRPGADDMLFCPECRREMLAKERARMGRRIERDAMQEMQWYESRANRAEWDMRIVDENGREVWASDLARRYLSETTPRPQ